jgi:uncharacterized protein YprB with RNaseH-like and TPR domain
MEREIIEVETALGKCLEFRVEVPMPAQPDIQAITLLANFLGMPDCSPGSMDQVLFFDSETTGLSRGAGTWIFLLGYAQSGPHLVVTQYFLRDLIEEGAMLTASAELWPDDTVLITYNGKTFDLPLLETRHILNGVLPPAPMAHLDLLPLTRALFKHELSSCSLHAVEYEVLRRVREPGKDVDGAEIPGLYRVYLDTGNQRYLEPVFWHNVDDIVSLVSLTAKLADMIRCPEKCTASQQFGLAGVRARAGAQQDAAELLEMAVRSGLPSILDTRAREALAREYRGGEGFLSLWQEGADKNQLSAKPYVEMAKYYEHTAHDLARALGSVDAALLIIGERRRLQLTPEVNPRDLERRRERLVRKARVAGLDDLAGE